MTKRVFVTVGSTKFDNLIAEVTKRSILETLFLKGYRNLTIQIGKGSIVPEEGQFSGIRIEVFRYKDNLISEFKRADLVISHAGAGSCIEALEEQKPLIAVINDSLMNNHQEELAEALSNLEFCKWCHVNTLHATLDEFEEEFLKPYTPGKPQKIVDYIDSIFKTQG